MAGAAVIEFGRADHLKFNFATNHFHAAEKCVVMAEMFHGHKIGNFCDAGFTQKTGEQDIGIGKIALVVFKLAGNGSDAEITAAFGIQERGKNRGRIETWETHEIDGSGKTD